MTRYRVPERVAVLDYEGEVFIASLPEGPISRLSGTAAIIWHEALSESSGTIAERVASLTGADTARIAGDIDAFLTTLVAARMLVETDPGGY